jgi:site-specific DNA recombinase
MPAKRKTLVAAYIRVSTQEQKLHGYSLPAQRERIQAYADKHNMEIVNWYADEGVSGRKPIKKRPALMQMSTDAMEKKFDIILFIKLDRFFRSVKEYYEFEKLSDGTPWIAIDEPIYDLTTATGRLNVNIKLSIAQMEAETTAEREKMVTDYKIKQGLAISGAQSCPFGFMVKDKHVVHDPAHEADVMSLIEHFEGAESIRSTMLWWNDSHEDNALSYRRMRTMLTSTLLYGAMHDNLDYTEPYIDKHRWDILQDKVASRSKCFSGLKGRTYLFTGLLKCPTCGRNLIGTVNSGYMVYRCNGFLQWRACTNCSTAFERTVEKQMLKWLEENLSDTTIPDIERKPIVKAKGRPKAKIQAEIDRLNYAWQKGRLDEATYDEQYETLMSEMNSIVDEKVHQYKYKELPDNWQTIYNDLSNEGRRAFWHSIISEINIEKSMNGKRGTVIVKNVVVL